MLRYILRRILWLIPVTLGVLIIIFALSEITPGDPVDTIVGQNATYEAKQAARVEYGLDKPVTTRFFNYLVGIITKGDLGRSYASKQPVINEIMKRFPYSIELALLSTLLALLIALPVGVISAVKQYSWIDNVTMVLSLLFVSIPEFWFALLTLMLFSVKLGWLPGSGIGSVANWILPVAMTGIGSVGGFARIIRSSMLEVVRQDYIRTARAKGLREFIVIYKHGLRNALIPLIANVGNTVGICLGGVVVCESIFSIPGVGQYTLNAINTRDWPAIQGSIVVLSIAFCLIMLITDLLYVAADPRLSSEYSSKKIKKGA